jgi:enoyl-CoA hydratase
MTNLVTYSRSGPISKSGMLDAPHAAFDEAERDKKVVILTGRGNTFSAGFDRKVCTSGSANETYTMLKVGAELAIRAAIVAQSALEDAEKRVASCNARA